MNKNCSRYHQFTHMCTKNHNHMRYSSWYTEWDRIFCHFGPFFDPLPPNNPENQNFEKMKKASGYVIILNLCNKNTIIWCMLTQTWSVTDIIFCHFRPFFALLPHYWTRKSKFGKNVKKHLETLSFYTCVPLIKIIWCMVPEIWSATDRISLSSWAIFCPFTVPEIWHLTDVIVIFIFGFTFPF